MTLGMFMWIKKKELRVEVGLDGVPLAAAPPTTTPAGATSSGGAMVGPAPGMALPPAAPPVAPLHLTALLPPPNENIKQQYERPPPVFFGVTHAFAVWIVRGCARKVHLIQGRCGMIHPNRYYIAVYLAGVVNRELVQPLCGEHLRALRLHPCHRRD